MARPVRFNLIEKSSADRGINQVQLPEGHMGEGFFATSLDKVVGLARKNSMWPLPFATSCCRNRIHGNHGFALRSFPLWIGEGRFLA